jgi:hypothetical protein
MESTDKGKFAVYVFFTKEELEDLEFLANSKKVNISRLIRDLTLEELDLYRP